MSTIFEKGQNEESIQGDAQAYDELSSSDEDYSRN